MSPTAFYKYMKASTAMTVLATRRLRWSSPVLFNDLFDVAQELRLNFDEAELTTALNNTLAAYLEQGDLSRVNHPAFAAAFGVLLCATPEQRRAWAAELREKAGPTTPGQVAALAALKEQWRALVPTFRILCLSELKDVPSMWQHYADDYRGLVLEFSPIDGDSPLLAARPVVYQDTPPAIADPQSWVDRMLDQSGYSDLFKEYQYVKSTAWAYEKEWRIVSGAREEDAEDQVAYYDFHLRDLRAIYLGPRCSASDRSDLLALLAHGLEHVRAYDTLLDFRHARFTFQLLEQ
jgi:hypothetical protein